MKISSIADAVAVMDYLHRRELLCGKCGINLATVANQHKSYCAGCTPPHGTFNKVTAPNELERRFCEAIGEWLGPSPGTPAVKQGDSDPQADSCH